jgi:hypothetical protein
VLYFWDRVSLMPGLACTTILPVRLPCCWDDMHTPPHPAIGWDGVLQTFTAPGCKEPSRAISLLMFILFFWLSRFSTSGPFQSFCIVSNTFTYLKILFVLRDCLLLCNSGWLWIPNLPAGITGMQHHAQLSENLYFLIP